MVRRWIFPALALLFAAALVLPPLVNINRYHRRIADTIGRSIGRPVHLSSVKLHLLPRPGFEISDFAIEEGPGFGAEPILRCATVNASIRLISLWRGRLEIARISFDQPSLNLVRDPQGQWNFASLLTQVAQIPNAPTAQRHASAVPRFPYIEANNARVNFKSGYEKLPFSFLNADLSVWLANPGEWRLRFEAQPARTDLSLDLADTGLVRLDGSVQRAPALADMPLNLHAEWTNAPLGQLSRIMTGADANWRGNLDVSADIAGTTSRARLKLHSQARGVHRIEFEPREPLNFDATCEAWYTQAGHDLDQMTCLVPSGEGHLLLTGWLHGLSPHPQSALSLELNHVPAATALDALRLVHNGFAPEVQASGTINGSFKYAASGVSPAPQGQSNSAFQGHAAIDALSLSAPSFQKPIAVASVRLTTASDVPHNNRRAAARSTPTSEAALVIESFTIGPPASLSLSGRFSRIGFSLHLTGQPSPVQLSAFGEEFGLLRTGSVTLGSQGTTDLDLTLHGRWLPPVSDPGHPPSPLAVDGILRLHNAQVKGDFLAQPVQIGSAEAVFSGDQVGWTATGVNYGPLRFDGSLNYPLSCVPAVIPVDSIRCTRHFAVHLATLDAKTLETALLGGVHHGELLQQLLSHIGGARRPWPSLAGTVQAGLFTLNQLAIHDATASLSLEGNTVHIGSLSGHALDGALHLTGTMQTVNGTPHYDLEGGLEHASPSSLAALFRERWGTGSVNLTAQVKLAGFDAAQLTSSAVGTYHWDWTKGGLPVDSGSAASIPLLARFDDWTADGAIANGSLLIEHSQVVRADDSLPFSGTLSFARQLDLTSGAVKLSGSLEHPQVESSPAVSNLH